jgi:sialic acid synthase SpsE
MNNQKSSKIFLIGDPGSCHCGNIQLAKELVRVGKECGLDAVKFQLFPNEMKYTQSGNVPLSFADFKELVEYGKLQGIEIFASVFCQKAYNFVKKYCSKIKFSYKSIMSKSIARAVTDFGPNNVYASGDIMNPLPEFIHRLYCIPEYPVRYRIDFDTIFHRFDGFSDHTLGISQALEAVRFGAKIIEKHYRLDNSKCDSVPDGKFAIRPKALERLAGAIR